MYYAKSTGGFYSAEIHGDNIPADAVEITADDHAALLAGQAQGKSIVADASGRPVLADPPKPTVAQLQASAWNAYRAEAKIALDTSDVTVLRCVENAIAVPTEWAAYRTSLRAIVGAASGDPTQPLPVKPAYPSGT